MGLLKFSNNFATSTVVCGELSITNRARLYSVVTFLSPAKYASSSRQVRCEVARRKEREGERERGKERVKQEKESK